MNYGDIRLGSTLDLKFTTRQINGTPFTLAGTPSVAAYPANSTTELTAGITLSVDFDGRTGLNNVRVVATGGNGYATDTDYVIVIIAGTVNSVSVVGEVVGMFSIEKRSALMPVTAARTLAVDAAGLADANVVKNAGTAITSAAGVQEVKVASLAANTITAAVIADASIDRAAFAPDTGLQSIRSGTAQAGAASTITLDAGASATDQAYRDRSILITGGTGAGGFGIISGYIGSTKVATITGTWSAGNPDNTSTFAIFPSADTAASIATAVWAALRASNTTSGSFGEGLIAYTIASTAYANIRSALGLASANLDAQLAAAVTITAAQVRTAVGLASANLDTQLGLIYGVVDTEVAAIKAKTDQLVFTAAGTVDANIKKVNSISLQGAGTSGDKWRP